MVIIKVCGYYAVAKSIGLDLMLLCLELFHLVCLSFCLFFFRITRTSDWKEGRSDAGSVTSTIPVSNRTMDASTKADLEKECNAWNSNLESSHSEMHTAHVRAYAGLGMVPLPRGGAGGKIRKDRSSRNVRKKVLLQCNPLFSRKFFLY